MFKQSCTGYNYTEGFEMFAGPESILSSAKAKVTYLGTWTQAAADQSRRMTK